MLLNDLLLESGTFHVVKYEKEHILHLEGEKCTKLELILSGEVVVDHISESGDLFTIAKFTTGDTLGGNILFSSHPFYPMTVVTRTASIIAEFQKDTLLKLCFENPDFLQVLLQSISDHASILGDKIKRFSKRSIRERVLDYLHQEQQIQGTNVIQLHMTKRELAEKLGVQRTSLSRELAKMRDDKLILFDRHTITLI